MGVDQATKKREQITEQMKGMEHKIERVQTEKRAVDQLYQQVFEQRHQHLNQARMLYSEGQEKQPSRMENRIMAVYEEHGHIMEHRYVEIQTELNQILKRFNNDMEDLHMERSRIKWD